MLLDTFFPCRFLVFSFSPCFIKCLIRHNALYTVSDGSMNEREMKDRVRWKESRHEEYGKKEKESF